VTDSVGQHAESLLTRHAAEGSGIVTHVVVREHSVAETAAHSAQVHAPEGTSRDGSDGSPCSLPVALAKGAGLEARSVAPVVADEDTNELAQARREVDTLRAMVRDLQQRLTAISAVCGGAQAS
jgi:hypothetical protein